MVADSQGTKQPICAIKTHTEICFIKTLFPPFYFIILFLPLSFNYLKIKKNILGPVIILKNIKKIKKNTIKLELEFSK
jgi:hypothetical protein